MNIVQQKKPIKVKLERLKLRLGNIRLWLTTTFSLKNTLSVLLTLIIATFGLLLTISTLVQRQYTGKISTNINDVDPVKIAIVFGAGLRTDDTPSSVLEDRVRAAVDLYKAGKVQKIIMSGDNRFINYNEPDAMVALAIELGVAKADLQPDYAGRRTYDTCIRAKQIFGVDEAVLITQEFHLPRALYVCNTLGVESTGFAADRRVYLSATRYKYREIVAVNLAMWELYVKPPEDVVFGEKIPVR